MKYFSLDPSTGELLLSFSSMEDGEVEQILATSAEGASAWSAVSLDDRCKVVRVLAHRLRARQGELASLMSLEMGKLQAEAVAEIEKCAAACEFFVAHAAAWMADEPAEIDGADVRVVWQPLGTVLAVMPWNFPFWQVIRCAIPALLGGNAIILKHAPNVPQCAQAIAGLMTEAGLPAGVFQSVFADNDQVARMIADRRVQAVTLTGSERAGKAVAAVAGQHLKKCVLELGGSDAFVVLEDAPLEQAVTNALTARFQNAGQSCIAAKRFIVVSAVHDAFVEKFREAIRSLECRVTLAPLARADLRDGLHAQVSRSLAEGARCETGGQADPGPGFYYQPTLLAKVDAGMPAADEEMFGPVASVLEVADEAAALAVANASKYGLGASVWTADLERGTAFARQFQSGMAFVNTMVRSDVRVPFGGIKSSGYGRELSQLGMREFMNAKTLWVQ